MIEYHVDQHRLWETEIFFFTSELHLARGRVGRVTDCGVSVIGLKSQARFVLLEEETVFYHEWLGMVRPMYCTVKWVKKSLIRWSLRR